MYKKQSGWSNKSHRTAYMDHLLLQQQQRLENVFQEGGEDVEEADVKDSATKLSTQMHSAFVRHLRSYVADGDVVSIPSLEIRVKNFSFDVPMGQSEAEGKTKIPTVFNYSPIYWCKKGCEKLCRRRNVESALRKKQVKSVLSNVNLSLEAGKMYLIIGPPSSGKTSLLNGKLILYAWYCHYIYIKLIVDKLAPSHPLSYTQLSVADFRAISSRRSDIHQQSC